jgi:hypothetical protein
MQLSLLDLKANRERITRYPDIKELIGDFAGSAFAGDSPSIQQREGIGTALPTNRSSLAPSVYRFRPEDGDIVYNPDVPMVRGL